MHAKFVSESLSFKEVSDPVQDMGIGGVYSTKDIKFTIEQDMESFMASRVVGTVDGYNGYIQYQVGYDNTDKETPVILVTPILYESMVSIEKEQLEKMIDAVKKDFIHFKYINFKVSEITVTVDEVLNIFLLWKFPNTGKSNIYKAIALFESKEKVFTHLRRMIYTIKRIADVMDYGLASSTTGIATEKDIISFIKMCVLVGYDVPTKYDIADISAAPDDVIERALKKYKTSKKKNINNEKNS